MQVWSWSPPGATTVRGSIVFRLQGRAGSRADPALAYELAPRQTKSYADTVTTIGGDGSRLARFYSDSRHGPGVHDGRSAGSTGVGVPIFTPTPALAPGQYSSLVAPADPARQRFNISVRSLETGAKIRFILFGSNGIEKARLEKEYPANYFEQRAASDLLQFPRRRWEALLAPRGE